MDELLKVLESVLADGLVALLGYAKQVKMSGSEDAAADSVVVREAGKTYVKIFVPFMRRALVEGVYGVSSGGEEGTVLGMVIREWEGWLAS